MVPTTAKISCKMMTDEESEVDVVTGVSVGTTQALWVDHRLDWIIFVLKVTED